MTPDFKKQWFRKKAHELPADAELVSCVPLSLVLDMFGVGHIDFLSLDVEVMHGHHWLFLSRKAPTSMLSMRKTCVPSHRSDRDGE